VKAENILTFSRVLGAFILPFILTSDIPRIYSFIFYVVVASTDLIDGAISRASRKNSEGEVSSEGDIFDPVADKMLFISALLTLSVIQKVPLFASVFIVLREIWVLGLRALAERNNFSIKSSILAKLKTFAGNFSAGAYILKDEYFGISAEFVGDIALMICFILAVISGAEYTTKYIKMKSKKDKRAKEK